MRDLLKDLEIIRTKHKYLNSQKEKYNIFSVLYREHDERKLHSRFIASLLDPYGSHEKDFLFLNEFLKLLPIKDINNFKNSIVYPEEWNKKENNNIDILIIDRINRYAVIIENKIFARDSNNENGGQLERYFKHVRDKEKIPKDNITTIYLTLDGHEPSCESLGSLKINYHCYSYNKLIIDWLNKCIPITVNYPYLRESIFQYKNLICKMTKSETEINERLEIKNLVGKSKNSMESAKYLIDNFKHIKWHTVSEFWDELSDKLKKHGNICKKYDNNHITDITHYEIYRKGQKNKQSCGIFIEPKNKLNFFVWHEGDYALFFGINDDDNISIEVRERLNKLVKEGDIQYIDSDKKYWWKYCLEKSNKKIFLSDFSEDSTFNLINNEDRCKTIEDIDKELDDFINHLNK